MATLFGNYCDLVSPITVSEGMQDTVHTQRVLGLASLGVLVLDGAYSLLEYKLQRQATLEVTIRAWLATIQALQGHTGTVVDDADKTRENVLATRIAAMYGYPEIEGGRVISGIGAGWIGTLRFTGAYLL